MLKIEASSTFWSEESDPFHDRYVFVYTIRIINLGTVNIQILSRHWMISNGFSEVREVKGAGVVGLQPIIAPNDYFEYSSSCPLSTPYGSMHGQYQCRNEHGELFDVDIRTLTCENQKTFTNPVQ